MIFVKWTLKSSTKNRKLPSFKTFITTFCNSGWFNRNKSHTLFNLSKSHELFELTNRPYHSGLPGRSSSDCQPPFTCEKLHYVRNLYYGPRKANMNVGDSLYQAWLLKRLSPVFYHSSQTDRSLQSWYIQTQQLQTRSVAPAMIHAYETYLVWNVRVWNSKYRSTNWFINRARSSWITLMTIW